jgi:hypothetical protein
MQLVLFLLFSAHYVVERIKIDINPESWDAVGLFHVVF